MRAEPINLAVVGAGLRSQGYARYATEAGLARVVAVAEPDPERRETFAATYALDPGQVFTDWQEMATRPKLAEAVIIGTQDAMHADPAVAFAELGYHILVEKPMASTEADAERMTAAAEKANVLLAVCHVMRYTPYSKTLKKVLDSGRIGTIVSVDHLEPVGWWHQAHSYVRGNWRKESESTPMLMSKSCHDVDWLMYMMDRPVRKVSSFGSLTHFRPENRPAGAADRCLDCAVESSCPYSAPRLYMKQANNDGTLRWPVSAITTDSTADGITKALATGPYGRCVYDCDNDVVDHQVVNFEFADGATASFTMTAFTASGHRKSRFFGTRGSIDGDGERLTIHDFVTDEITVIDTVSGDPTADGGHGGGDMGLVTAFFTAVATGDRSFVLSDGRTSLETHHWVWAAEHARHTGTVVST